MIQRLTAGLDALGAAGVLAIGFLLFSAGFYALELRPAEHDLEQKSQASRALTGKSAALQRVSAPPGTAHRLYSLFPPANALVDEVERLHRLAVASGLKVPKADYRLDQRDAALGALHASLPVRGPYANVRRFLAEVLKQMPTTSIDGLSFERKKVGDAEIDVQVRLTLYFQPPKDL